jgi:hypothetical protein
VGKLLFWYVKKLLKKRLSSRYLPKTNKVAYFAKSQMTNIKLFKSKKKSFPANPCFKEPVSAIHFLGGPQHGVRDPEEDPDPVGPVQEVPGGPNDHPRALQPVLHSLYQTQ